jgi:AraC-like DNA-binding protein/mannose-6-phosphate isomerase-like protein (cupin superfamily)
MSEELEKQEYKHVFGEKTLRRIAHSGKHDERDWLRESPLCEILTQFQIHHLGEITASKPYSVIRHEQDAAFFLSTLSGSGKILVNGEWITCGENQAVVLPPNRLNALRADTDEPWKFHYVRYHQEAGQTPFIRCKEPVISNFSTTSFSYMMNGFLDEVLTQNRAKYTRQWLQLIKLSITDFCEPWLVDDRLWKLWDEVVNNLNYPWTLDEMSQKTYLSGEHLRRLTTQTYGRSPMKHLGWLRMQRAAELLIYTQDKVEVIGMECGYKNVNTFTMTFKKFFNLSPSEYRGKLA